jgi:hypothetical protein
MLAFMAISPGLGGVNGYNVITIGLAVKGEVCGWKMGLTLRLSCGASARKMEAVRFSLLLDFPI